MSDYLVTLAVQLCARPPARDGLAVFQGLQRSLQERGLPSSRIDWPKELAGGARIRLHVRNESDLAISLRYLHSAGAGVLYFDLPPDWPKGSDEPAPRTLPSDSWICRLSRLLPPRHREETIGDLLEKRARLRAIGLPERDINWLHTAPELAAIVAQRIVGWAWTVLKWAGLLAAAEIVKEWAKAIGR